MLGSFVQAFKTPDLRRKLLFTLFIMAMFRMGSFIPTPGVDTGKLQACVATAKESSGGLLGLVDIFSGGALLKLSVFALGIMPYITASIIIQLMRVVIPRFEDLHKEGQSGQTKLTQYTRYLTIFLAVMQSTTFISMARTGNLVGNCPGLIKDNSVFTFVLMIMVMTAGTGLIMWLGEQITERGIGNGMSLLIFTSIVANFPVSMIGIGSSNGGIPKVIAILALVLVVTLIVVFVEQSNRRIPVQYAKRMVGRRLHGGSTTYIPIKVNMAGVIPVIFASSILSMPQLLAQFASPESAWVQWIRANLGHQDLMYVVFYGLLTFGFTFFYTSITFNPDEIADNMKKYGGFIPGIRAGRPTADYLRYVISRMTTAGAIYLTIVAMAPEVGIIGLNVAQMPFGGTTILIIVGVGLQTVKEINSQLQQHHYEGFLR